MRNRVIPWLLAATLPTTAWSAGGHYPVDDADLPDPGEFGIELWHSRTDGENSQSALSAYRRPGDSPVELIAELQYLENAGRSNHRFEPQVKYQLTPMAPNRMGGAVMVHVGYEDDRIADWLVNLPVSYDLPDLPVRVHGNLGWMHERGEDGRNRGLVGGGVEWQALDRLSLIGQAYREGADADTEMQIGVRAALDGMVDHLDLAAGRNLTGTDSEWFLTAGLAVSF